MYGSEVGSSTTVSQFQDNQTNPFILETIIKVDNLLQEIRNLPATNNPQESFKNRSITRNNLETAYTSLIEAIAESGDPSHPPKEITLRLADVMRQAGQMCYNNVAYPKPFEFAKQMLLPALELYMYSTGAVDALSVHFLDSNMFTLPDLESYVKSNINDKNGLFEHIETLLSRFDGQVLQDKARDAKLSAHDQFAYAYTLRWLNGAYRTAHERYQSPKQEEEAVRIVRHAQLLGTAKFLLGLDPSSDEKDKELIALLYNDMPGFFKLTGDMKAYYENYDQLIKIYGDKDDFLGLRNTYNKMACGEPTGSEKQKEYWGLAVGCEGLIQKSEQHPGLQAQFLSNLVWQTTQQTEPLTEKELTLALERISRAKAIVTEQRKYENDCAEFKSIDNNYYALMQKIKGDAQKLLLQGFAQMELAKDQADEQARTSWNEALDTILYAKAHFHVLGNSDVFSTIERQQFLALENQSQGIIANIEKNLLIAAFLHGYESGTAPDTVQSTVQQPNPISSSAKPSTSEREVLSGLKSNVQGIESQMTESLQPHVQIIAQGFVQELPEKIRLLDKEGGEQIRFARKQKNDPEKALVAWSRAQSTMKLLKTYSETILKTPISSEEDRLHYSSIVENVPEIIKGIDKKLEKMQKRIEAGTKQEKEKVKEK